MTPRPRTLIAVCIAGFSMGFAMSAGGVGDTPPPTPPAPHYSPDDIHGDYELRVFVDKQRKANE